jgi:ketosteroid isomerase-like protein
MMTSSEKAIRAVMDERAAAMAARDIERLMAVYTADVIYFDLVPPFAYTGAAALRSRFIDWFGRWESPIGQHVDHLRVIAADDVAIAFMLIEATGTLKGGRSVKYWVRTSNGLQLTGDGWRIAHEHVSLPVDMATRSAVLDLVP